MRIKYKGETRIEWEMKMRTNKIEHNITLLWLKSITSRGTQ